MKPPSRIQQPQKALSALLVTALLLSMACVPLAFSQRLYASDEGFLELQLKSSMPELSNDNGLYSLEGARFGVFGDYECKRRVAELVTDETGCATLAPVAAGRYYVRQEVAPSGFAISDSLKQVAVVASGCEKVEFSNEPFHAKPERLLVEHNGETDSQCGLAGAKLGNATYVVSYYDTFDESYLLSGPARTWRFQSDSKGEVHLASESLVDGSPLFHDPNECVVMPIGRYNVVMEKAPQGFKKMLDPLAGTVAPDAQSPANAACAFPDFIAQLQPIRGDFAFSKTDANGKALAGIPFLLISESDSGNAESEKHVILTDENGYFSSDASYHPHDANVNGNDEAIVACIDSVYKLDESKLGSKAGTWFSRDDGGSSSNPQNEVGALPYGSYVLQELSCTKNEGMNLIATRFTIHRDGYTVKLDNIVNTAPSIAGYAFEPKTRGKLVRPTASVTVTNEITYRNLVVGKRYVLSASAYVNSSGSTVKGPDGQPALSFVEFTPREQHGVASLELSLDTSELAGEKLSIVSELKSEDGMTVHQDNANIADQELAVEPLVKAQALDNLDADKYCMGPEANIHDRMSYEGLNPESTYTLICTLNDKATGNSVRDEQGNVITSSAEFKPEARSGFVDVRLAFDADKVAGHDVVVFDKLVDENGIVIADHQDFDDESQTIKTVKLSSSAIDKADGDKMFDSKAESVVICDTVNYANLEPGKQYVFHGALMDKDTGCSVLEDGEPIVATAAFVPTEVSGTADVEYSFDANKQSSQVLVAYETLEHEGNVIARHADLEDVAQTVTSEEKAAEGGETTLASQGKSGKGPSSSITTGDRVMRTFMAIVALVGCIAACVACTLRHRRKTIEAIARLEDARR